MKLYVYSSATSPALALLAEHTIVWDGVVNDDTCAGLGFEPVQFPAKPEGNVRPVATLVDGDWVGSWETVTEELLTDAAQAAFVRARRDERLVLSDWTQIDDVPVNKSVWALYRQALRDITTQPGFPHNVVWPAQP